MAIPESQLETWSHQGAVAGSCDTYNEIKKVLEASTVPYAPKDYKVFLQGSYGNDTNVYKESDVDVVIQLNQTFKSDTSELPSDQVAAWDKAYDSSSYGHSDFRKDVLKVRVRPGNTMVDGFG
jgi:DNA polymerase sigma